MPVLPTAADLGQRPDMQVSTPQVPSGISDAPARAMVQAGQQAQNFGDELLRAKYEADKVRAEDKFVQLQQGALDLKDGPNGFSQVHGTDVLNRPLMDEYMGKFDAASKQIASSLATEQQKAMFNERAKVLRLQQQADLIRHINHEGEVAKAQVYDAANEADAMYAGDHYLQQDVLAVTAARAEQRIQARAAQMGWSADQITVEREKVTDQIAGDVTKNQIFNNPSDFLKSIGYKETGGRSVPGVGLDENGQQRKTGNTAYDMLSDAAKFSAVKLAVRDARDRNMQAQAEFLSKYDDERAALLDTGTPIYGLSAKDAVAAGFNDKQVARFAGGLQKASDFYNAKQLSTFARPEQELQIADSLQPKMGPGYAEGIAFRNAFLENLQHKHEALAKDPAGFVIANAAPVREAFAAAQGDLTKLPQAVSLLNGYYDQMGVPANERNVVPEAYANGIAANLSSQPAAQRVATLADMAQKVTPQIMDSMAGQMAKTQPMLALETRIASDNPVTPDGYKLATVIAHGSDLLKQKPQLFGDEEGARSTTAKLDGKFDEFVGNAYSGNDGARRGDLAGFKAVYAFYVEQQGKSGFDDGAANAALKSYFGTAPAEIGQSKVFAPYGMDAGIFAQNLEANIRAGMTKAGADDAQISNAIDNGFIRQVGHDQYTIVAPRNGALTTVSDANGTPLVFDSHTPDMPVPPPNRVMQGAAFQ